MKTFLALICFSLLAQSQPQIINVPIQNASFADPVRNPYVWQCGTWAEAGVPGWVSSGYGTTVVTPDPSLGPCTFSLPPDGHAAVLYQATISQDLGNTYALFPHDSNGEVVGFLKLKVSVANQFYWYDGTISAWLSLVALPNVPGAFTGQLCSTSGIPAGDFTELTLVCPFQRVNGELTLSLSSNRPDWNAMFAKVSLSFTSEE